MQSYPEVICGLLFRQMLQEVFRQRFSFQQDESQKHPVKETEELLRAERSISFTRLSVKIRQHHNRELQITASLIQAGLLNIFTSLLPNVIVAN